MTQQKQLGERVSGAVADSATLSGSPNPAPRDAEIAQKPTGGWFVRERDGVLWQRLPIDPDTSEHVAVALASANLVGVQSIRVVPWPR